MTVHSPEEEKDNNAKFRSFRSSSSSSREGFKFKHAFSMKASKPPHIAYVSRSPSHDDQNFRNANQKIARRLEREWFSSKSGRLFQPSHEEKLFPMRKKPTTSKANGGADRAQWSMRKRSLGTLQELKLWASNYKVKSTPVTNKRVFLDAVSRGVSSFYGRRQSKDGVPYVKSAFEEKFVSHDATPVHKSSRKPSETEVLLMRVLSSPISTGYFMAFCESEFNAEYLQFYIAVEDLRTKNCGSNDASKYECDSSRFTPVSNRGSCDEDRESWQVLDAQFFDKHDKCLKMKNYDDNVSSIHSGSCLPIESGHYSTSDGGASDKVPSSDAVKNMKCTAQFGRVSPIRGIYDRHFLGSTAEGLPASPMRGRCGAGVFSENYILLPKNIAHNTLCRLQFEELYGADVFSEAIQEVLIILRRDIFLRFLKSSLYVLLNRSGNIAYDVGSRFSYLLPKANRLFVKSPESGILNDIYQGFYLHRDDGKCYTLQEILSDGLLFNGFLLRLKASMTSESLLCIRMITTFNEFMAGVLLKSTSNPSSARKQILSHRRITNRSQCSSPSNSVNKHALDPKNIPIVLFPTGRKISVGGTVSVPTEWAQATPDSEAIILKAWEIYSYFIARGAAYEISMNEENRTRVMRLIGNPRKGMFDFLESVAMTELVSRFRSYKETEHYRLLNKNVIRTAVKIRDIEIGSSGALMKKFRKAFRTKVGKVFAL